MKLLLLSVAKIVCLGYTTGGYIWKKKVCVLVVNWIEIVFLLIINYYMEINFVGHICMLGLIFFKFVHSILEANSLS